MKTTLAVLIQPFLLGITAFYRPILSQQACVRDTTGNVVCGELVPTQPAPTDSANSSQPIEVKTETGLDFILKGCNKSSDVLVCSISVYNSTDFDQTLSYASIGNFSIIDSEGNTYIATSNTSVGNNERQNNTVLPPKLTMSTEVVFQPSGPITDSIRILNILPRINDKYYEVIFRDFSIS